MKIAITTTNVPFVKGGAEFLAENLKSSLREAGHEADIISMPFIDSPIFRIEDHIVASRLMDIEWTWGGHVDLCIGLKFPAYFMPHPNKVIWTLHQHRAAYDLFNTELSNIKNNNEGKRIKRIIENSDQAYLSEAKRIYTIADNVTNRMKRYSGIKAATLYHPCPDMEKFFCDRFGDYILMPSRINPTKRQFLALEAMTKIKSDAKLYIVGKADNDGIKKQFFDFLYEKDLEDKVKYFDYVDQTEKLKLYAGAKAVLFIPKDEDYGYITLEAMSSSKAIITCTDSGGPLEFVKNNENGIITDPVPESIASAIDILYSDNNIAEKMGVKGKMILNNMNITWENVVKELTK